MALGLGGGGNLGVAFEVTEGTWVTPAKFIPIMGESLSFNQPFTLRRPIRGLADVVGAVRGNGNVEGDVEFEVTHDVLPYFLYAMRVTVVKSGVSPDFVYTFTPAHQAEATPRTLAITVVRNNIVFGYTGCKVGSLEFSISDGLLMGSASIVGRDEATQAAPTPAWGTETPFDPSHYTLQIPVGTAITNSTDFTFTINDNAEAQYRLGSLAAQRVTFGEREATLSLTRDFEDKTEYTNFRDAVTSSAQLRAEKTAARYVQLKLNGAIRDSYEVALEDQGSLISASVNMQAVYDSASSKAYEIVVGTSTDIT